MTNRIYTEQEVARIAELRLLRYELLKIETTNRSYHRNRYRIKAVTGELWQLTQNIAYR